MYDWCYYTVHGYFCTIVLLNLVSVILLPTRLHILPFPQKGERDNTLIQETTRLPSSSPAGSGQYYHTLSGVFLLSEATTPSYVCVVVLGIHTFYAQDATHVGTPS